MSTIKAVVQSRAGDPAEVLDIADVDAPPPPGTGQVTIAITRFPVHPGDLQTIAATRPDGGHPAAVGAEATGVITAAGAGVELPLGTRVAAFFVGGAWRQQITVDADAVVGVPAGLTVDGAAQMLINPVTVLMLRRAAQQHHSVGFDGVILNNAAASSVGRLFTAGAQHHQIATISIVRSTARADELGRRFPDVPVVSMQTADWKDQVRAAAAGRPIAVALDPIGGSASADLLTLLDPGGSLILYGLMAPEQIPLHAATLRWPSLRPPPVPESCSSHSPDVAPSPHRAAGASKEENALPPTHETDTVLVTGVGEHGSLGYEVAESYTAAGARVIITGRLHDYATLAGDAL